MKKTLLQKYAVTKIFRFLLGCILLLLIPGLSFAQSFAVSGTVRDEKGVTLPGVTVKLKGTPAGAVTDVSGKYHLKVPDGSGTLVFSFIGFETQEVPISNKTEINIVLKGTSSNLAEVVVTALGIKRSSQSLSYATQQVSSESINTVKTDNLMNALSGKVAGLTISPSASGVGGSTKVLLRGNKSFNGNNQPLYVIDGIPLLNAGSVGASGATPLSGNGQSSSLYATADAGDGISNLNPEDIESISVLEGASAAALYGSQAQNGVILVVTKKGKAGKAQINFASSYSIDHPVSLPKFQNQYGPINLATGAIQSWGAPISGPAVTDPADAFFKNGMNATNSISLASGSENLKTYFSYANTHATGVEPTNKLNRNNLDLRETASALNNKLTVDGSVSYVNQSINNSPVPGVYSILNQLYTFPRGVDILPYKNEYEIPNASVATRMNWLPNQGSTINPWWALYREPAVTTRNRLILSGTVKYEFTKWVNFQVRGNVDRIADNNETDIYAGTLSQGDPTSNGQLNLGNINTTQKYGDAILNFTIPLKHSDFKITGLAGGSITDVYSQGQYINGNLSTPDFFNPGNILITGGGTTAFGIMNGGAAAFSPYHSQLQALFGSADVSYKNWVYLTATARNDWSSNLSYTNNFSYFYPSAGLSVILSNALKLPDVISYAKLRGSFAQVGNTIPPYLTNPQNSQDGNGALQYNNTGTPRTLQPEKTNSLELGTELRFFDNRLNFTFTYYKTNTINQYFLSSPSVTTLVQHANVNAGNIQNSGVEFTLGYDVLKTSNFTWNTAFNGAMNKNKIIALDPSSNNAPQYLSSGTANYASELVVGGSYGDIYTQKSLLRNAQGQLMLSGDGTSGNPYGLQSSNKDQLLGNPNPKFQLGWSNSVNYKNFSLNFLIDGKFGGKVLSMTQANLDYNGVSEASGNARAQGGVKVSGVNSTGQPVSTVIPAQLYYQTIGAPGPNQAANWDQYSYSATVVRLREAALGYTLRITNSLVKSIRLSVTGRNLIYFYKKAPFDPEVAMSTGNGLSGVDLFTQPSTRNVGLNLNATF